ncbi:DUF3000 domain-containing protein [Mycetocola tolaasinivorans]|uniref:DUF3000 domain-containing protein n=1 Tax=Mycetocola tolaasinivorans TaxID=76635 RepID=A0A3L7AA81_9MICO|nr:DUF3000 domain-containing protein [Mycetocola tolaasinivorans]RLP76975.1 DUF3000 domain-containing protein [Mycetocola tolaasinivorans]
MTDSVTDDLVPADFVRARDAIRSVSLRPELRVQEIAAPERLAPYALALAADVLPAAQRGGFEAHASDSEHGAGRFVLLYDPSAPEAWGGAFRIICFAQAPLEPELGVDPFMAGVAWSWLMDALEARDAQFGAASGTATKVISTGFGELASAGDGTQLELRASWTPHNAELGAHVEGWGDLLCLLAGLPPTEEGVTMIGRHRGTRG